MKAEADMVANWGRSPHLVSAMMDGVASEGSDDDDVEGRSLKS